MGNLTEQEKQDEIRHLEVDQPLLENIGLCCSTPSVRWSWPGYPPSTANPVPAFYRSSTGRDSERERTAGRVPRRGQWSGQESGRQVGGSRRLRRREGGHWFEVINPLPSERPQQHRPRDATVQSAAPPLFLLLLHGEETPLSGVIDIKRRRLFLGRFRSLSQDTEADFQIGDPRRLNGWLSSRGCDAGCLQGLGRDERKTFGVAEPAQTQREDQPRGQEKRGPR